MTTLRMWLGMRATKELLNVPEIKPMRRQQHVIKSDLVRKLFKIMDFNTIFYGFHGQ